MKTRLKYTALITAALSLTTISSASAQEILLGYLPAVGGPFATFSKTNLIAAQMAVDEVNAAGGISGKKIRIVSFDTAGKPDQAVIGVRKLAEDDKVLAVIGPFSSSECRVAFPAAERAGMVLMSMASSAPNLAEPFTYAFRNTTDEGVMFSRVMRALKDAKYPTATGAIAYATDDVIAKTMGEKVLPALMKKAGTDIKLSVTFQNQSFDFAAQASQLKGTPTDLVGIGSGPEAATRLAQELNRQGYKGRMIAGSTIADPELPRLMGKAGDGTIIPTTFYGEFNEDTKKFEAAFIKKAKAEGIERSAAAQFDAATYDIVLIYAEAMKKGKITGAPAKLAEERTIIRDQLKAMKEFPALEGPISFGANGDALKPVYVLEMKDSKWTLLANYPVEK
ncbi:MAG: ABC transporter substrate-binding protein [Rhodospirillales bacterium]|nr:ABC transporter substrate-binding protein [Rhodospirillales bacterium]